MEQFHEDEPSKDRKKFHVNDIIPFECINYSIINATVSAVKKIIYEFFYIKQVTLICQNYKCRIKL